MEATGQDGELRVGYHVAARLGSWRLLPTASGWEVRARFLRRDAYWCAQRPLTLVLAIGALRWSWTSVDLQADDTMYVDSSPEEGVVDATHALRDA